MRKIMGLLLAVVAVCGSALAADEYKIDPNHSSANFAVTHLMVSTVNGRFTAFEGKILYDDKDVTKSSVNVAIKTASINTDNTSRDNDLRSPGFFDAEKFPEITFQSKSIEKKGNDYVAHGTLTIKGVTFNAAGLGLSLLTSGTDFLDSASANKVLSVLGTSSTTLRSEASALGSNLSIVQVRQDFSKNLINVLQSGSSNLTLADTNEEAANSQALSTRQSIAVSALSLANQSQQSVLQLLR